MIPSKSKADSFDFAIEGEPLAEDAYAEFLRAAGFFAGIRATLIDFLIVDQGLQQLQRLPDQLGQLYLGANALLQDTGALFIRTHVIADQVVSGFLSASSTFRDRLLHRLGINTRADHPVAGRLRESYDSSFAYRICYNLRNFGQHVNSVLNIIPIAADDLQGNPQVSVKLALRRDRLLQEMDRAQKRVLTELSQHDTEIPFLPLAVEYGQALRTTLLEYIMLSADELIFTMAFANALEGGARNLPDGATPLLFKELPTKKKVKKGPKGTFDFKSKVEHFSLDELSILLAIFPELVAYKEKLRAEHQASERS